ncbi:hypothetical protein ACA910_012770 [Epithemia clementina (nom. ined.)]
MATEQSVLDALGRALWMPRPTTSDLEAQQLAFALGYPSEWRVVRTLEPILAEKPAAVQSKDKMGESTNKVDVDANQTVNNHDDPNQEKMKDTEEKVLLPPNTKGRKSTTKADDPKNTASNDNKKNDDDEAGESTSVPAINGTDDTEQREKGKDDDEGSNQGESAVPAQTDDAKKTSDSITSTTAEDPKKANDVVKEEENYAQTPENSDGGPKQQHDKKNVKSKGGDASSVPAQTDDSKEMSETGESVTSTTPEDSKKKTRVKEEEKKDSQIRSDGPMLLHGKKNVKSNQGGDASSAPAQTDEPKKTGETGESITSTTAEDPKKSHAKEEEKYPQTKSDDPKLHDKKHVKSKGADGAREPPITDGPTNNVRNLCIVDRIYAGKPGSGCDMWYNHYAAMKASQQWVEEGADPHRCKGGHTLPRAALFDKGDRVEVFFDDDWWEAKVLRRKEHSDGFRYQVYYAIDKTKQNGIPEERIRALATGHKDPHEIAVQIGLGEDWQAVATGNNRWKITSPTGQVFTSKKAALQFLANEAVGGSSNNKDEGDPPWRAADHEYVGRLVRYTQEHAVSARRTITVEQIGRVVGWISETDVDKAGEPGYVDQSGKPAKLFHVVFDDEAHLHKYGSYLVESQDMEEFELEACLIPPDELPPPTKKQRKTK